MSDPREVEDGNHHRHEQQQPQPQQEHHHHHQHLHQHQHPHAEHHAEHHTTQPAAPPDPTTDRSNQGNSHQDHGHQQQQHLWEVPDQLAKILEAARGATSSTKGHVSDINAHPTEEERRTMYEQARHVFAHMPPLPNAAIPSQSADDFAERPDLQGVGQGGGPHQDSRTPRDQYRRSEAGQVGCDGDDSVDMAPTVPTAQSLSHQYESQQHNIATVPVVRDLSAAGHGGEGAAIAGDDPGYATPEDRSARSHTDELRDEENAGALGSTSRSRVKRGRTSGAAETLETDRQRKDLHKEVERKRRAGINQAISELQSLVPDCSEKGVNKGDIILRAAAYIRELKNSEASNIEKWTLEKLLMDQALHDGQVQLENIRAEVGRLREALGKTSDDIPRTEDVVGHWDHSDNHEQDEHQQSHQPARQEITSQQREISATALDEATMGPDDVLLRDSKAMLPSARDTSRLAETSEGSAPMAASTRDANFASTVKETDPPLDSEHVIPPHADAGTLRGTSRREEDEEASVPRKFVGNVDSSKIPVLGDGSEAHSNTKRPAANDDELGRDVKIPKTSQQLAAEESNPTANK